jgi:glyoxylase-like metal-dependent hydrolase (beta-lactamase superfamily II)
LKNFGEDIEMRIHRISLPLSNAFLICDRKNLLVDAGCRTDLSELVKQIENCGVRLKNLAGVVLTHVHFDHCGCASELRKAGVPVIASSQSRKSLSDGVQEGKTLLNKAPSFLRSSLQRTLPSAFPGVEVDVPVVDSLDLHDFGVDGRVAETPGHTEASLSVILANNAACVGDLLMGGVLGLPPAWKPAQHPSSADFIACLDQIQRLRKRGIESFYVGHGDVLEARHIDRWIANQSSHS